MDIRLILIDFMIVLFVMFSCIEAEGCTVSSCKSQTCIQDGRGSSFCNNCTNGKVGLKCNIDNPCIGNDHCAIKNCIVLLREGETVSSVCLASCEGQSCSDPCESQPCHNNGLCVPNGDGTFNCICPNQWNGPQCEDDVDECQSNPCKNSGTCNNSRGTFICLCMAGFNGSLCEINIDDCQGHACMNNGTCEDLVGSYRCQCPTGKAGLRCQVDDPCLSNPCKYKSHCSVLSSGNYSCNCRDGYTGIHCDEDIDECAQAPREICEQGGTCVNKIGSFSCLCPYGLTGDRCEVPLIKCHENLCENGGTCLNKIGKYECFCLPGFSGDTCNVSGVCQGMDCNGAGCSFVNDHYKCDCPANTTGHYCEFDLNGRCLKESCMEENCNKCQNGAKCSGRNSSVCECTPGFYGPMCQFSYCSSNPCRNGGTCIANKNSYRCECLPSYEGDICERFLDGCRDCLNGGSCISNFGSCMCLPGYSGDSCEVLPCQSAECLNGGSCQPNSSSRLGYSCRCRAGYSGNNCEHFSLCEASKPCSNGGTCTDLLVGFDCNCPDQWKGKNCSIPACDKCKCCRKFGTCSDACNLEECKYIDKECKSLEKVDHPFEKCAQASHCSEVFKDGKCDSECNTEECLYDGFDCKIKSLNCPNETFCRVRFEDGQCDKQCYNLMCMWDGTDCEQKKETIQGVIVLKLFVHRNDFEKNLRGFLYDLSHRLTCMVKLSTNQDGTPAISDIDIPGFGKGVEVRLKLVFSSSLDACFSFIDTAGDFIKKFSENNTMTDFPIYDISTAPDQSGPSTSDQTPIFITIGTIFSLLMVALLVGLWMKKRKVVDKTWFPPGFGRSNKSCTRTATDQMSSGSEKQIIEGSDSFSEESFDTGTLSKASRATFPGDMSSSVAPSHLKVAHNPPSICVAASSVSYNHQIDYMTSSFRPQFNVPLQDDIFTKIINEAMCHYDQTGETPLHLAARYSRADAAQKFLENGADPNAQDHDGKTPLHVAIAADAVGVFQILLRCRCSVNVQTKDGTTPLICAVRLAVDGMVGDLIKAEADLNKTDDQGKTGLHWAAAVNNLDAAILLLHHGGINRDVQDDKGQTPLFLAAKEGSFNVAQLLLHNSASMDLADQLDRLPRDIAIEKKHYDIVKLLDEYLAKASQNRGQSNFSGHLLMSESTKGMKQKNKALPQSEVDGSGRSKKKRKIDMMDVVSDANQSEMFATKFHQNPQHFAGAPYSYISGPSNAESKQMYTHVLHWNRQNQNEFMLKEHIRMRNQKGQKKKNDFDKWFIGSTGSSPTDSEFAVIQSPNEGSSGSPGYCNNGGVFLSPPEADHYQQHMLPAGDGVPRCMPASVIQRYHPNPAKNSQLIQTSYGRYDDTYHDRAAFSKSSSTSAPLQGKQNQPLVFQQYPTPPSQQFSPNGISSVAQVSCLNSTQRENLFETPSPGAGDQWVDISMITCMEPHSKQKIDNVNESSVC